MLIRRSNIFMYNILKIKTFLFFGLTIVLYVLRLSGSNGYMHTSLTFLISFQNNLNKPCRSSGFYFKIKIWEGGDEMQRCFISFGHFLTKCNVDGSLNVKDFCFRLNIILFETVALINKIVSFSFPIATFDKETNFFNKIMQLINPNYHWKNQVKQIKINLEKLLQICICYSITKDPDIFLNFC